MARWDAFFDRDLRRVPDVSDLKRGAFFFVDFPEILPAKMQACILEKPFSLNSGNGSTPRRQGNRIKTRPFRPSAGGPVGGASGETSYFAFRAQAVGSLPAELPSAFAHGDERFHPVNFPLDFLKKTSVP